MPEQNDPRTAALVALVPTIDQRALVEWLLDSLDALEQRDFGEVEPIGVASPAPIK